jgi:hypothetical protein
MTATVDHDLAPVEPEAPEPPRSRGALVAWGVVAALVVAAAGAWVVNRETLLAQWSSNHERLVLTAMQRVDDELNRQVWLPQSQRSSDALAAATDVDLAQGNLVDLGGGQVLWKSERVGSNLNGSRIFAVYAISTVAEPVNSFLGSTDRYDELASIYTGTSSNGNVTLDTTVCSIRHGTSADAPVTTARVQISPNQWAEPCPADIMGAYGY